MTLTLYFLSRNNINNNILAQSHITHIHIHTHTGYKTETKGTHLEKYFRAVVTNFLAPGASFMEDTFSTDWGRC